MKLTNPNSVSNVNQRRGPTTGQTGESAKRRAFLADRRATEASAKHIASLVAGGSDIGLDVPRKSPAGRGGATLKGDVNVGRGPTKGNK
jgi:hypothetical protein